MKYDNNKMTFYKEQRYVFQKRLIEKYKRTLLSIKVDYPGNNRNNNITKNIINCIDGVLNDIFIESIYMKIFKITAEGPVITFLLDLDSHEAKNMCDQVANKHILGRVVDLEIYDLSGKYIKSENVKHQEKKCIICGRKDSVCKSRKTHNQSELVACITNIYKEYTNSYYGKDY